VILAIPHFGTRFNVHCPLKVAQAIVLSIWIVCPPIWFWYEYFHLYRPAPEPKPDIENFKYGQDQAAKIWLALVTLLLALYFGKDFTRDSSDASKTSEVFEDLQNQRQFTTRALSRWQPAPLAPGSGPAVA
jgi:hypothetical protein